MTSKILKVLSNLNDSTILVETIKPWWLELNNSITLKIGNFFGFGLYRLQFQERKFLHISLYFVALLACTLKSDFQNIAVAAQVISFSVVSPCMSTCCDSQWDWFWEWERWLASKHWSYFSSFSLSKPNILLAEFSLSRQLLELLLKGFCWCVLSLRYCQ